MRGIFLFLALTLFVSVQPVSAQTVGERAAVRAGGTLVKKIALPVTLAMVIFGSHEAYAQNCYAEPTDADTAVCTASTFLENELNDFAALAEDGRLVWSYVIVPEAEAFWDRNGDDIIEGGKTVLEAVGTGVSSLWDHLTRD